MIDLDNLKLVDSKDVPESTKGKYRKIFASIPKGKAAVFEKNELNYNSAQTALHNLQKAKQYLSIKIRCRKKQIYIVNQE